VASGPGVGHWAPRRDERGSAIAPVRIALASGAAAVAGAPFDALLPVPATWVEALVEGDTIEFVDLRRRPRALGVVRTLPGVAVALSYESAWVEAGTELRRRAADGTLRASARVAALPPVERSLRLCPGDRLVLTRDPSPGRAAPTDGEGRALGPAIVPCTLPEAFACARPGEPVWFDDGKIGGRIASVGPDAIEVDITHAKPEGSRLGADKGINLPDTRFDFAGLTAKDRDDLAAVADHVDVLGLSFVDDPDDVRDLWRAIRARTGRALGGMIKIETKRGFARLPEVLLAAMEGYPVGVMIARGDLAVECGFERMAELQEEILWLCEAAHVPVVWATQVLENVAKKGRPTRAEITDAAMAVRAECVMLNKGPHLLAALRVLDDVLRRMEEHQRKKTTLLRPLSVSAREVPDAPAPVSPSA
jgi:pyruvate kinase